MTAHYVYAHECEEHGVFYVGKGSGNRLNVKSNRGPLWKRYAGDALTAFIISRHDTDAEAMAFEQDAIRNFKRMGLCQANVSLGGHGVTVPQRWWGAKISASLTGVQRARGPECKAFKDFCDGHTLASMYEASGAEKIAAQFGVSIPTVLSRLRAHGVTIRALDAGSLAIVCTTTGQDFKSIADAARTLGVARENIRKVLAGKYRHTGGYHFERKGQ